jgi:hypothetical protein
LTTIESVVQTVNRELAPRFEERLRHHLAGRDKEWLIEQIVRLSLGAHGQQATDQGNPREAEERAERVSRLRDIALDLEGLREFSERYATCTRERLIDEGYLLAGAPAKGTALITPEFRTSGGEELLVHAKDVLFGLLFGDESTNTRFDRAGRELLTLTLPRHKAGTLDFMKATTELGAVGTWQDPESVSNDSRADNVVLEVEYSEVEGEWIGQGIVRALALINNLETNEQVLYARMIDVEQSTLIE